VGAFAGELPHANGTFIHTGGASGEMPPTLSGGDPTGEWTISHVTVYLPGIAAVVVDAEASTVEGDGWFRFGDGTFEFEIDVALSVVPGPDADPLIASQLMAGSKGTYEATGTNLSFSPACYFGDEDTSTSGGLGGDIELSEALDRTVGFATDGQTGQLLVTLNLKLGPVLLLIDVARAS
jgi:hypothetical protein